MSGPLAQLLLQTFREHGLSDEKIKALCRVLGEPDTPRNTSAFAAMRINFDELSLPTARTLQGLCITTLNDTQIYSESELAVLIPRALPAVVKQLRDQGLRLRGFDESVTQRAAMTHGGIHNVGVSYLLNVLGVRPRSGPPIATCATYVQILKKKGFERLGDFSDAPLGKVKDMFGPQTPTIAWLEGVGIHPSVS